MTENPKKSEAEYKIRIQELVGRIIELTQDKEKLQAEIKAMEEKVEIIRSKL